VSAPIVLIPMATMPGVRFGRVTVGDAAYDLYRKHLRRTVEEEFVLFLPG
jgi:hypothetical protein